MTVPEVYFWDGWQTVEETNSAGTLVRQYVWGEGIDECLKAHLLDAADIDGDSSTTDYVHLYYHHNSIGSVVAVTNAVGAVKESYRYSAFGKPTIYNGSNVEIATTAVEQPFMFTGARYDFEEGSGLYQMRHRYYDPVVGRFVSRDPLGLWGDPSQNGNGQGYCGHDPINGVDPLGLSSTDDRLRGGERDVLSDPSIANRDRLVDEWKRAKMLSKPLEELVDAERAHEALLAQRQRVEDELKDVADQIAEKRKEHAALTKSMRGQTLLPSSS